MPKIIHYKTPVPEVIKDQVLAMVFTNVTDIAMVGVLPANHLHSIYQFALTVEVRLYLESMDGSRGIPVELTLAMSDSKPDEVVGFVLYLPVKSHSDACGVTYMVVKQGYRRQGVARSMVADMIGRYPHAALTCVVEKVPFYTSMGFQVVGVRGPQVSMNTRDHHTEGTMGVIDVTPIYQSIEVRNIHADLVKKHGLPAMAQAERDLERHVAQMSGQAEAFVMSRPDRAI